MFICVWNCLIFFVGEYSSVWPEICRVLSQIQWRFLRGISEKTIRGEFFGSFVQTKDILYRNLWNFALLSAIFILCPYCAEKVHTSTSYVVCTQVRRHVHKRIIRRRYREENPGRFVFGKPFCSLSVWDLLRYTPYVFWFDILSTRCSLCLLSFD